MPASGCPSVCVKVFTVHGSVQVMCQIQIGIFWMPKGMLFLHRLFIGIQKSVALFVCELFNYLTPLFTKFADLIRNAVLWGLSFLPFVLTTHPNYCVQFNWSYRITWITNHFLIISLWKLDGTFFPCCRCHVRDERQWAHNWLVDNSIRNASKFIEYTFIDFIFNYCEGLNVWAEEGEEERTRCIQLILILIAVVGSLFCSCCYYYDIKLKEEEEAKKKHLTTKWEDIRPNIHAHTLCVLCV